jgi:glycosyltransferase involved in cell wall biosynthesis
VEVNPDNKSKKIAIFIDALSGGGAEKVMMSLASQLVKLGHQPELIVLTNRFDYDKPAEYPVHILYQDEKVKVNGWFDRKYHAKQLTKLVTQLQSIHPYDLFLSNLDDCNRIVSACNFTPCYYVVHNSIEETIKRTRRLGPLKLAYLKRCLKALNGQHLITVSHGIEQEIRQHQRIKAASISTIYNPFDILKIQQLSQQSDSSIPKEKYFIHVGRLAKQKRHDILFQAFAQVPSEYKLVCLCNKPKKALKLADKYGIKERLIVPGFKQNPYNWIASAEVLVLSSDFEGLPTVLIEAIACNTVPVSTICPHGPDEILLGDLTENLVSMRDPVALSIALNNALERKFDLKDAQILPMVDAKKIAEQYLKLI